MPIPQLSRLYIPPPVIHIDNISPGAGQGKTPSTARPSPFVESTSDAYARHTDFPEQ